MKGLVVYKSRYGATEQYAKWISEALGVPLKIADDITPQQIACNDYIIAGSSIYMGKILLKDWLKKNADLLKTKRLILFIVGAAPPEQKAKTEQYFTDNIPKELQCRASCFYLQGKSIHKELSLLDKLLLKAGAQFAPTADDKKAMLTEFNAIKKENIDQLLETVKELTAQETV